MKIKDLEFEPFIGEAELSEAVLRVAERINADYQGRKVMLCPVLTGSYMFFSDLSRRLTVENEVCFVKYTSYEGTSSTGTVSAVLPFPERVRGKDVLIVEDIVDTGVSMDHMLQEVRKLEPRSVRVCALFSKPGCLQRDIVVDYVGREIGNEFIVGYGLDYDQEGRTLKEVYVVKG
jgi:hypoxanthine phosphoribosyltransferase